MVARLCDWAFLSPPSIDATADITRQVRARAAAFGRSVQCAGFPFVLWRDSEDEAAAEVAKIIAHKDSIAAGNWLEGVGLGSGSFDQFTLDMMVLGAGALPVVGTARQVAEKLAALHAGGMDGLLMVFQAYYEDTLRFEREVLPILREMGVR